MRTIDIIAYTGTVIGIGGIAGAIERGTSPVTAVVCMAAGCVCMRISYKKEGVRKSEKTNYSLAAYCVYGNSHSATGNSDKRTGAV